MPSSVLDHSEDGMFRALFFSGLGIFLTSCGLINKITGNMEQMRENVSKTNETSQSILDGQRVTAAIEILLHSKDFHARTTAAETLFLKGPEDRVSKYIGMPPVPLRWISAPRNFFTKTVNIPNVTYVAGSQDSPDKELTVAGVSVEYYEVISFTAQSLLEQLHGKSRLPDIYREEKKNELEELKEHAQRMLYIATAILGASDLASLRPLLLRGATTRSPDDYIKQEGDRLYFARLIRETLENVGLNNEALRRERDSLIDARLGIGTQTK